MEVFDDWICDDLTYMLFERHGVRFIRYNYARAKKGNRQNKTGLKGFL